MSFDFHNRSSRPAGDVRASASHICSYLCDAVEGLAWDLSDEDPGKRAAHKLLFTLRDALDPLHEDPDVAADFMAAIYAAALDAASSGPEFCPGCGSPLSYGAELAAGVCGESCVKKEEK